MKNKYDIGSIVLSCSLIVLGFFCWTYANNFSTLGAIFPKTFSIVLILCSFGYIILSFIRGEKCKKKDKTGEIWRGLILFIVLFLWCLLLEKLGFIISSVGSYVILATLSSHEKKPSFKHLTWYCFLGIMICGLFWLMFCQLLGVPLPKGLLPF